MGSRSEARWLIREGRMGPGAGSAGSGEVKWGGNVMLAMKDGRSFEGVGVFSVSSGCGWSFDGGRFSENVCCCSGAILSIASSSSESTGGLISQLTQTWLVAS